MDYGFAVHDPCHTLVARDDPRTFVKTLQDTVNEEVQLVVVVVPSKVEDRYGAIKRVCLVEKGVANQVVLSSTLSWKVAKGRTIANIASQIKVKLGGELWHCSPVKVFLIGFTSEVRKALLYLEGSLLS